MKDKKIDIHDLFKDYNEKPFKAELMDFGNDVGSEIIEEFEDQIDLQTAKKELEKIKSGESEIFTWEEVFEEDKTKEKTGGLGKGKD